MGFPGSRHGLERLVEEYYELLYRYAYRLAGNAVDAEDLTQEAFCSAQSKWDQLRQPDRVKSWLFSILRNAYLHKARGDKLRRVEHLPHWGEVADPTPEALPEVEPEALQRALDELPEDYRTPIILYYFEDFSYRDIAGQMDLPLGTVMSRLARAKAYLRSRLLRSEDPVLTDSRRRDQDGL